MYTAVFSEEFKRQLVKIKRKNPPLYERLEKKIRSLLLDPSNRKHLRNILKGQQRVHLGPFVLRFNVEREIVYFITIEHHDDVY